MQAKLGFNEVKAKQVPEWQKIMWRYLDWVCLVIVSRPRGSLYPSPTRSSSCYMDILLAPFCMKQARGACAQLTASCYCPRHPRQIAAAVIAVAVPNDGNRGWTSFVLLVIELNLIVWVGWWTDRNAGNAVKELEASVSPKRGASSSSQPRGAAAAAQWDCSGAACRCADSALLLAHCRSPGAGSGRPHGRLHA